MPEHQSWFRFLPNYEALRAYFEGRFGDTWYGNQAIELQHVFGAIFVLAILFIFGLLVWAKVRDVKKALLPETKLTPRTFAELLTEIVLGQLEAQMGAREARFFLPLIGTCAFFIFFSNSMGLLPGFSPPTSDLNTTLALAAVIVLTTECYGIYRHRLGYLKEFVGGLTEWYWFITPLPYLMFLIEVIGHLARLVSLSFRLLGNMYADHTVVGVFSTLVPFLPILVPLPPMILGVLVILVQTAVFCLLSIVYIGLAVGEEEGEGHGSHSH
ncbi:MAG: F0F1 ATP synthase subunit A [Acidobacteria bacterium]|nr:F0F1 ATP synthase subunit A [Acidobacteriota bacterium]